MASNFPPDALVIQWGSIQFGAFGTFAIAVLGMLVVLWLGGRALRWW